MHKVLVVLVKKVCLHAKVFGVEIVSFNSDGNFSKNEFNLYVFHMIKHIWV